MSDQEQPNFMDRKTLFAIALVGLCWVAWQSHMKKKYPDFYAPPSTTEEVQKEEKTLLSETGSQTAGNETVSTPQEQGSPEPLREETINYSDEYWSFTLSNRGMGLRNIELKKYTTRDQKAIKMGKETDFLPFETRIFGQQQPLSFSLTRVGDKEFVGKAFVGELRIEKRVRVLSEQYSIKTEIYVSGVEKSDLFTGLQTFLSDQFNETEGSFFFLPSFERQETVAFYDNELEREIFEEEKSFSKTYSKVNMAAISSQYFTLAIHDESDVLPTVKAVAHGKTRDVFVSLSHMVLSRTKDFKISYTAFSGPKSLGLLSSVHSDMKGLIDFGWFDSLAVYILKLMKLFYKLIGNWGVAIILLTLLVRIVVLPFNLISFRSMKKMQKIQPLLKTIREKHKDDRERMNQETMRVMREAKANPIGGCLPMLLQFPVFIALYQVLGQSIELYQAPFAFWIQDLSLKDPFFILPVLMGLTMYFQQKMTPSTMDPTQQKIMKIMPVLFALFMINLPSGLTLYIFVSSLFAVVQQYFFMKPKEEVQPT